MGDVAMTVPVLLAFRNAYPSIKITLLTKAFFTPFFQQIPNLEIKVFETKTTHKGILGIQKLAKELKEEGVDAIADLHNVLRTNILKNFLRFSRIPFVQIDKGRAEKKALIRWENKVFRPLKTSHQRYAEVFKKINLPFDFTENQYVLNKELLSSKLQDLVGIDTQKWLGIAPFAKHKGKVYPLQQLNKVIAELSKSNDYKIFLFGGGDNEVKQLNSIETKFDNVLSLAGKLTLTEELHLISNLDLMLSMDSSNGHIAAMYGIPVITIWGITHPYAGFIPYGQPPTNSILPNLSKYPKIPTSIYGNKFPEGYENVMESIAPITILERISKVIQ